MMQHAQQSISKLQVSASHLTAPVYPPEGASSEIVNAVRENCMNLGWMHDTRGAFGNVIHDGARVVVKPNLVLHSNQGSGDLLPLVTHSSLIQAVVEEVLNANPLRVVVGDAPIQSCDLARLLKETGLADWAADLQERDPRFAGIHDFRRTVCVFENGVRVPTEELQPLDNYVLYNLGSDSMLEPISGDEHLFRVTCYDPEQLRRTHAPGNHQYLIAREIIDADVVINLPKLKTHKKAGITNALKNLVGINGNKEFLPHHRFGGSDEGGDCYPGRDIVKRTLETVLDQQNSATSRMKARAMSVVGAQLQRLMRLRGDELGVEGSWSGNETVARMTLDLNRILLYGRPDASLAEQVQRCVLHICDAVIAGQGDGPLASDELPLGLVLASENAAAMDWVGAHLLGYDVEKIPLLQLAYGNFRWPIVSFLAQDIELLGEWGFDPDLGDLAEFARRQTVRHPAGWRTAAARTTASN